MTTATVSAAAAAATAENESVSVGSAEAANGLGTALQVNEGEDDAKVESRDDGAKKQDSDCDDAADATAVDPGTGSKLGAVGGKELVGKD